MSYVRFGTEDSGVYVYLSTDGVECCMCGLDGMDHASFHRFSDAMAHLKRHEEAGHVVPGFVYESLECDMERSGDSARRMADIISK